MTRKLSNNQIHVWHIELNDEIFSKLSSYINILTVEEKNKADNFKFKHHRRNNALSYIILKLILSTYMNIEAKSIRLDKNKYGKPFLISQELKFNITHSKNKLAIALATVDVGIDIEYIDPNFNFHEILYIVLSSKEREGIEKLTFNLQKQQFFQYWTQKEALVKAMGVGLNIELNKLDLFTCNSGNNNIYRFKEWTIELLDRCEKNYIGHIAYKSKNRQIIEYHNYEESFS